MYSNITKGVAEEKVSTSYMEKGTRILWRGEYIP